MRDAISRSLPVLAGLAAAAAAVLALSGGPGLAVALLALAVALLAARSALAASRVHAELASLRSAQRAAYERSRSTLEAVERVGERQEAADAVLARLADEASLDGAVARELDIEAAAPGPGSSLLLVGGPPVAARGRAIEQVLLGHGMLALQPHGAHARILLSPTSLPEADADERRWLARALRWPLATIVVPAREETAARALLRGALGAEVELVERGRLLELRAPAEPAPDWGAA